MEDEEEEEAGMEGKKERALVKNAPLATSYLHKLSFCAPRTGTIWKGAVEGSLLTRRDSLSSAAREQEGRQNTIASPAREHI